jgi:hypothetical protein
VPLMPSDEVLHEEAMQLVELVDSGPWASAGFTYLTAGVLLNCCCTLLAACCLLLAAAAAPAAAADAAAAAAAAALLPPPQPPSHCSSCCCCHSRRHRHPTEGALMAAPAASAPRCAQHVQAGGAR